MGTDPGPTPSHCLGALRISLNADSDSEGLGWSVREILQGSNKVLDWFADHTLIMNLTSWPAWVDPRPDTLSSVHR